MDRYQVGLVAFPGDETTFLKTLRIVGKISLADAVKIHAYASVVERTLLGAGVDRRVADHIGAAFVDAGIPGVVEPSSIMTPMICRPQADETYRWNAVRQVVVLPLS